ncbi:MAG: leucine-rich repeat domain-containing protein, partial [Candidatus Kariarchaeaceae archaeon]
MDDHEELVQLLQRLGKESMLDEVVQRDSTTFEGGYLTALDLGNLDLESLPLGTFDHIQRIRYLDIGLNRLHSIANGMFDYLPQLEFLNLSGNRLTSLPSGIFNSIPNL